MASRQAPQERESSSKKQTKSYKHSHTKRRFQIKIVRKCTYQFQKAISLLISKVPKKQARDQGASAQYPRWHLTKPTRL